MITKEQKEEECTEGLDVVEDFFVPTVSWVQMRLPPRNLNNCLSQPPVVGHSLPPPPVAAS